MAANPKYELSLDDGATWKHITRTEAKKRISKSTFGFDQIIKEINQGRIFTSNGWGWIRRKPGRWHKGKLKKSDAKRLAKYLLYRWSTVRLPVAAPEADVKAVLSAFNELKDKELAKFHPDDVKEYEDVLQKWIDFSP